MATGPFTIHAHWDDEARVWWTDGEDILDIPCLCCQQATFEPLVETVFALAPQLLIANGVVDA